MRLPEVVPLPRPDLPPELAPFLADPAVGDGTFHNPWGVDSGRPVGDLLRWQLQKNPFAAAKRRRPELPVAPDPLGAWGAVPAGARVQWLGHATVLVELDGVHLLIDPLFGSPGPGLRRHAPAPRLPADLPRPDAVLLTHGHRDHFDRKSLAALAARWPDTLVAVPLGLAPALPRGFTRTVELSWWQAVTVGTVRVALVPAQHWHQRGPLDRNRSLWGGFHLQGTHSLYHSGDTGYFGGFAAISAVAGPPDVAVLPLGAYEPRWFMGPQHMGPQHSVQAFLDLGATHFVGMHWGTFDLTDEPLDHGAATLLPQALDALEVPGEQVHVLAHGGVLGFGDEVVAVERVG